MSRATLGVNVDHVATLRQARGTKYPDPVAAAVLAEFGGADQITVHLREDRRHIHDDDAEQGGRNDNVFASCSVCADRKSCNYWLLSGY